MKRPDEVKLSRDDGEALMARIRASSLSGDDQRLLVKLIELYFWLTVALQETKISLKRLKQLLFGRGAKRSSAKADADEAGDSRGGDDNENAAADHDTTATSTEADSDVGGDKGAEDQPGRRGHGRQGADAYTGAKRVVCNHEELEAGQRCPACGRGSLYRLPEGVEIRIDSAGLLNAVRYELEKLRCSGCGEIFTAELPPSAGVEKYTPHARAVIALCRYQLGVPFHRLEQLQALVGVPVADATLWDQAERVANGLYPVFEQLQQHAAQSPLFYHDDTGVRIQTLLDENHQRRDAMDAGEASDLRVGMYTTAIVAQDGERSIVLYFSGRDHAGENLSKLLADRDPSLPKPLVMSDALAANTLEQEAKVIRCYCLSHGIRAVSELEEFFPHPCQRVLDDLARVYDIDAETVTLSDHQRLVHHQVYSEPILTDLKTWLEQQFSDREVEPNSSLGKAFSYLLNHWTRLTQYLRVAGAPLDNNVVEVRFVDPKPKPLWLWGMGPKPKRGIDQWFENLIPV
jgi:transposase